MRRSITRRALLTGAASLIGSAALAAAPDRSIRPRARPGGATPAAAPIPRQAPPVRPSIDDMIAASEVSGDVSIALWDAETGQPILERNADRPLPPASVMKALTALYALDTLGADHRFTTTLVATQPVVDGVLEGDLILAGGGDPTLVTDHLAEMAQALKDTGLREVRGRFGVWAGALPYTEEIDPPQLDHLGYNPAVSGLNLNFNRVHFEWARVSGDWRVTMDARSDTHRPAVSMARMRVADRSLPIYTYADGGTYDDWSVASGALGEGGARWLPVRKPALYAGDVFQTFARSQGIVLPAPERMEVSDGIGLVEHSSAPLSEILTDMLLYSTNLTAEAVGLAASLSRTPEVAGLDASAAIMSDWLAAEFGTTLRAADHSGLGDDSEVSASDLTRVWSAPGVRARLAPLMKEIAILDGEGRPVRPQPSAIRAKTGTLNFVTTLSGYQTTVGGRHLAFAILATDLERRAAAKEAGDEIPSGSITYNGRAKRLQQALLSRWGAVSGPVTEAELAGAPDVDAEVSQPDL